MQGRVFNSQAEAQRVQNALRRAAGLPRRDAIRRGSGPWPVSPEVYTEGAIGWAEDVTQVFKHPTRDEYFVEASAKTEVFVEQDLDDGEGGTVRLRGRDVRERPAAYDNARRVKPARGKGQGQGQGQIGRGS